MLQITKRAVSALLTVTMALCSFAAVPANAADEETKPAQVTISFDCSGEGISIDPDAEGNIPEGIDSITDKPGSSYRTPEITLSKVGYSFEGWTYDGVKGFLPDTVFQLPDTDAVMKPVFSIDDYEDTYKINYSVEIDGKVLGKGEKPSVFYAPAGKIVKVSTMRCEREGYYQKGWCLEDGTQFEHGEYLVMPDHDVEFTPEWKKYVIINYVVGDVDRVNGAVKADFEKLEGGRIELQKSDRFSRSGFKLTGWLNSLDGKVYLPEQSYIVPGEDVTMTAVWTPIKYTLVFDPGAGADLIKIKGETDTSIVLPECTASKPGYKFSGWKYQGDVYQPGEEFLIKGAMPGLGYLFDGVWTEDSGESTTSSSAETTTTTTTTSSSTTTSDTTTVYEETTTFFDPGSTTFREIDYFSIELFDKESGEPVYDEEISCVAIIDEYPHGSTSMVLSCTPTKDKPGTIGLDHSVGYLNYYVTDFATASTSKYEILPENIETKDSSNSKVVNVKLYLTKRPAVRIRFFDELTGKAITDGVSATLIKVGGESVMSIELRKGYIYDIPELEDKTAEYTVICNSKSQSTSTRSQLPFRLSEDGSTVQIDVYIQPWYYHAGDANCDGQVNIADAVLVMQVATNPDKYAQGNSEVSITSMGATNADVDGVKGLSNSDALLIQKFKLGLIKDFRESVSE